MASRTYFIQTILITCLLAKTETTVATGRCLLQTSGSPQAKDGPRLPSLPSKLPPLSKVISAMSPAAGKLPSLSQGSLPPLSTIISAMSPRASKLPSFSEGSLPPLSSVISAISPSFPKGSLPKLSGMPPMPSIKNAAPLKPTATSPPSRPSTIPNVPTGWFSLPVLSAPTSRTRA